MSTATAVFPSVLTDLGIQWSALEPRYQALQERPLTPENATQFLLDWSDLQREANEAFTILYIRADLNTADAHSREAYLQCIRDLAPRVQSADAALKTRIVQLEGYEPPEDARLILKRFQTEQQIFREENLPLFTELAELSQQYSQLTGSMLVDFQGEQLTVSRVEQLLLSPDRQEREGVWKAWQKARLSIAAKLDGVFLKQLRLRQQLAHNAGFSHFQAYQWKNLHRYDYTPQDCLQFHQSIEQEVVPLARKLLEKHRQGLGVAELKPWDFYWRSQLDSQNRPALQPFKTVEELQSKAEQVFTSLSPELGRQFAQFRQQGAMDLGSRENKMGHAYCAPLTRQKLPFVLQNVVGMSNDVTVTLHEFGHAFHAYTSMKHQRFFWNTLSATEFVEVPSQGMECLALPHLQAFYTPEEIQRITEAQISRVVHVLPWIAFMDAFQDWIYTQDASDITVEKLDQKCRELLGRFQPEPSWAGFEQELGKVWQYYHMFNTPLYYIEYAFSWVGALTLWKHSLQDPQKTLQSYLSAIQLGDSCSVPELYEAAGLQFVFDRQTVHGLMDFLRSQLSDPV
ncbi:M3 family oligoendopeptidase [Deinococcus roseus]|uniref:Oligoendopeptidase F n=1 Tax=Deinococcus roseus TaxID=392414 RepID=A0ABQ2CX18_9DEIO|nr:M3 family oligoendopeptidase [Deinococcus roseus]GGJ18274.1 oligoendopeptidase F [Deinococcus roseus]